MEPELKALIDEALSRGATREEVRKIMTDFYSQKKKVETTESAFPSAQKDSTESTSPVTPSSQKNSGVSASIPSVPIYDPYKDFEGQSEEVRAEFTAPQTTSFLYDGKEISEQDAGIVEAYAETYNSSLENYFEVNFSAERYYEATGRTDLAQRLREAPVQNQQGANRSQLNEIKSRAVKDSEGNLINPYNDPDVINELLKGADLAYSSSLQRGDAGMVGQAVGMDGRGRSFAAMGSTGNPVYTAFSKEIQEGIESAAGSTEEEIEERNRQFQENAERQLLDRNLGKARARLMASVNQDTNDAVRSLLPADVLADDEKVKGLERHLFEEYQISADINNTGYIGDTSEGRPAVLDMFLGLEAEVIKLVGTGYVAAEDAIVKGGEAINRLVGGTGEWAYGRQQTEMHRRLYKELEASIERKRAVPLSDPATKFESGDLAGGFEDVFADFGHSLPMMAAAIVTQRTTGSAKATAGVVSGMGALTAYDIARDEDWFQNLSTVEQGGFVFGYGVAEGAPAFVGAKIFDKFRGLRANSSSTAEFVRGLVMQTPLAMGEEALTEAVTGGMQYLIEAKAKGQEVDLVKFDSAIKNGFYAGGIMGGMMAAGGSSTAVLGLAASSIPSIQSKLVIKQLTEELNKETTESGKRDAKARLVSAIQADARGGRMRRAFYESLRESDVEAYGVLVDIQTQISRKAIEHERTTNKSQRRRLRNDVNKLVKERTKIERRYDVEYDLNSRAVTSSIMGNVNRILEEYNIDSLFEGKDTMTVEEANADATLEKINDLLLSKLSLYLPLGIGRISDPDAVRKGLQNTVALVKTLAKTKPGFKGVVLHKTVAAMASAVGADNVARGVHIDTSKDGYGVHLLVPAILENTAYHEGYHELGLQNLLGSEQISALALELSQVLQGDNVVTKFNQYLSRVLAAPTVTAELEARGVKDPSKASIEELMSSPLFAEEFLAELLADITTGKLSVEVKRGLVERFSSIINKGLASVPLVGSIPSPSISDLGRVLQTLTGKVAKGESVATERTELKRAVERRRYSSMSVQLLDDEDVEGKREAVRSDAFEVTSAKEYADGMAAAIQEMKDKGDKRYLQVTALSESEVEKMMAGGTRFLMLSDGMSGLYLDPNGYMGGLFRNPNSKLLGVSAPLMILAEEKGMVLFDAFGSPTKLEGLYVSNGFKPVARVDFNEDFAPEGWDDSDSPIKGKPDIVFFLKGDGKIGDGARQADWDAAYEFTVANSQGAKFQGRIESLTEKGDGRVQEYLELTNQTEQQLTELTGKLKRDETLRPQRDPRVVQAIQNMADGEITQEEYLAVVREVMPIKPFNEVPPMPTLEELGASLKSNQLKTGIYDLNKAIPDGYFVGLRLDIPAYQNFDTWIVSVHEGAKTDAGMEVRKGTNRGNAIAYAQTGIIENVTFGLEPTFISMNIGRGYKEKATGERTKQDKTTVARMYGDWVNHDPSTIRSQAESIMASREYNKSYQEEGTQDGWIQVGMNPFRHSWFYDKRDGRPVSSASEVIQVGALVLAKNTVKVSPDSPLFATGKTTPDGVPIKFQDALSQPSPANDPKYGPKLVGQFAQSIKDKTIKGERVGQGYITAKNDPQRFSDEFILTLEHAKKDKKVYVGQAAYLAKLDIVASVRKFRPSVFEGKNAVKFADEVYAIYIQEVKENLLFLHDAFDAELREVATLWYDGANIISQKLAAEYGLKPIQVAAAMAALSPQKDWYQNVRLAEVVLEAFVRNGNKPVTQQMVDFFKKGGKSNWAKALQEFVGTPINQLPEGAVRASAVWGYVDLNIDKRFDIISPSGERGGKKKTKKGEDSRAAWGSLTMIEKAIRATTTDNLSDISELLGNEHKIRHFFNNIHNPGFGSDATIDTHAVAAALLKPLAGSSYEVLANFGTSGPFIKGGVMYDSKYVQRLAKKAGIDVSSTTNWKPWANKKGYSEVPLPSNSRGIRGTYFATLEGYRRAAEERGLLPREMQSITWEAVRLLYTSGFKTEANKNRIQQIHNRYRNGEITKTELRESLIKEAGGIGKPDWASTIQDAIQKVSREQPESRNLDTGGGANRGEGTRGRGAVGGDGNVSSGVKFQDSLINLIADFIDKEYSNPVVKRDRRRKNPVRLEASIGQMSTMVYAKRQIVDMLKEMGMTEKAAKEVYALAYQFKKGRILGKKEARPIRNKLRKMTTEANNLRSELEILRDKSTNYREFLKEAIEVIKTRMKENGKTPFSSSQIQQIVRVARMAHKVSGKRLKSEGYEVMQTFIDKLSEIFDKQDSKKAMQEYLDSLKSIASVQKKLASLASPRKSGEALKSTATYNKYAEALSKIDASLLDISDLGSFEQTLQDVMDSMKKPTIKTDANGKRAVSFPKLPAEKLAVMVANFQSLEELGRNAVMLAKAERLALKNNTSVDEEYKKLKQAYERSNLSVNRKNILKYMEEWNRSNPNDLLDSSNPAHIERVLKELYNDKVSKEKASAEMIVDDVLLPRVSSNIDALLDEPMIADILGIYNPADLDLGKLRERLLKLDRRQLAHLDYKLDDFIVNSSVFGIGYVHSLVRGSIDYASEIERLQKKGVSSRNRVYFGALDTVDSYIRMMFPTDNRSLAILRRAIGFGSIEGAFGRADFRHAMLVEKIEARINQLEKDGKKVTGTYENALMQIFSMSRQVPMDQNESQQGQNEAEWFVNLKGVMQRTIAFHAQQEVSAGGSFSRSEIKEMQDAYDFLFGDTNGIAELQQKVKASNPELVRLVDYLVDMHTGLAPQFSNYVERYLGKELVSEENYTPFDVRIQTKNKELNESMRMYEGFHKALQESSLSQTKRAAGSSFERNPRSLSGDKSIIGLNFLSINESTLRENVTLMETVGSTLSHRFVMNSEAANRLIPNQTVKKALEGKIARYVHQDTGKVPALFQKDAVLFGKRFENPAYIIRQAVIVKAFGGFLIQTAKQSNVLVNAFFQSKNPLKTFPYVVQAVAEMVYHSGKGLFMTDSKVALDNNGRYKLLQNSPVFSRDYEAGNIDPFTGSMRFDSTNFQKATTYLTNLSIKNLKGTDKVVAIASWFGFYADSLIQQGAVQSISEIDWDTEAINPNKEALSYADSLVTKDQAASTPRQAADLYVGGNSLSEVTTYLLQNFMLPFSRFAVNKKRSIVSDGKKLVYGSLEAKGEGFKALVGSAVELATFHSVGKILLPALMTAIFGEDEDRSTEEDWKKKWWDVGASTVIDFLPQLPVSFIDNTMRYGINKYILFPFFEEDNFGIGDETYNERFERWAKTKGGVPIYGTKTEPGDPMTIFSYLGPYGQFLTESQNTIENVISLSSGSNKVVSSTGREYYIRPEDREHMVMHYTMKLALIGSNIIGFGNKESEMYMKTLDDVGRNRSLSSEEELAAYEAVAQSLASNDPQFKSALEQMKSGAGSERFQKLMKDAGADPLVAEQVANKFSQGFDRPIAEKTLRIQFPSTYTKHIAELRNIEKRVQNSRDYYVLMRSKAKSMDPASFKEFKEIAEVYFSMMAPAKIETNIYLQSMEE